MKEKLIISTSALLGLLTTSSLHSQPAEDLSYPIVDTGQVRTYDEQLEIATPGLDSDFFGQDAQYLGNLPSYQDNQDETVTDLVTGLMWTKDPGEKMTYAQATSSASKKQTGGHADWRLPSIKELYSLIQLNGIDPGPTNSGTDELVPFIDPIFSFQYGDESKGERIIDSQFATSTKYVSTTMGGNETMFGVNFADGRIKGYPIKGRRGETRFHVLYVRGDSNYGKNNYEDNGDGTITDHATGLTWMKEDSLQGMDWPQALEYAENLERAGHDDWRLPSAKELQSIIDYTRSPDTSASAAIDPIFQATEIANEGGAKDYAHYWSSTTHVSNRSSNTAVYFAFGRSLGFMQDRRTGDTQLLDVHGAGSQRSDPKIGDASRYPHGRGPQGDVIRIQNMVRCVRGGDVTVVEVEETPEIEKTKPQNSPASSNQKPRQSGGFMRRSDSNKDGKVSRDEFTGPANRFDRLDKDGDGFITQSEAPQGPPAKRK